MSRKANPALIGLFVLGAAALLVAALVIFGSGRFFARTEAFVLFFEEEVTGLQVGAPVTFRGVRIGSVTDIRIRYDTGREHFDIPVFVTLEKRRAVMTGDAGWEDLGALIQRGLRAQLKLQSFVTGQVVVELDFAPRAPLRLVGAIDTYPEIPTQRSSISQIRASVSDLIAELRRIPIERLMTQFSDVSENMLNLLVHFDRLVVGIEEQVDRSFKDLPALLTETRQMIADMNVAVDDISALTRDMNRDVPQISRGALEAVNRLNSTLEQADASLGSVQNALGDRSPMQYQMSQALTEITAAASAMRVLAEYLQENPGVLLSGKGAQ